MGKLTNDMTRLCSDITTLHITHKKMLQDMARNVKDMRFGFQRWLSDMSMKSKANRATFISNLKTTVTQIRKENQSDLAGAHRAWFGR